MSSTIPKKTKTFIVVLLDESGSMGSKKNDVIGGFNEFLNKQKEVSTDEARLSLIKFNTLTAVNHAPMDLNVVPKLSDTNYSPGGGTALFDAIADGVRLADKYKNSEERVLCLIMTDGEENSSRETTLKQVQDLITAREAQGDWTFAYIGEQPERWARKSGLVSANTVQYMQHNPKANFRIASDATSYYRSKPQKSSLHFFSKK